MLQLLPWIVWLAAITSGVLLVALWNLGELGRHHMAVLAGSFLVAAYMQFGTNSGNVTVAGLVLQTILAVYLILRWKISG